MNLAFTQAAYWDLESRSQPFYDTSFKPALIVRWEELGNGGWNWVRRLHLEGGYEHHSNGREIPASRSMETLYFKPTFIWRLFGMSDFVFEPKMWVVFDQSALNENITDYWGNFNLQLTWRADFGLQIRTHTIPAPERTNFNAQFTYPLNRLWRPLNFYVMADYWEGSGEVFLDYEIPGHGWLFGIALSR